MKTMRLEPEEIHLGRKPKKPKLDQRAIAKLGNALYHLDEIKAISIRVRYKNGTSTIFNRSENEDRFERFENKLEDDDEDE